MKLNTSFTYNDLLSQIKKDLKVDFNGDHGFAHWQRVFKNTQILANHYQIKSEVFELFALLHDSRRENEYVDREHGPRASLFVKKLIANEMIVLDEQDAQRLIYACANHTVTDKEHPLYTDLIVKICFDSDRLDIGRVGIEPDTRYMSTEYAKELILNLA